MSKLMVNILHKRLTQIDNDRRAGLLESKLSTREVRKIERRVRKVALREEQAEIYRKSGGNLNKLFALTYGPMVEELSSNKNWFLSKISKKETFQGGVFEVPTSTNSIN